MSVRDSILIELVKEVLGPREGPYETLPGNQNPRDEYITGVLAPVEALRPPDDIDADVDAVIEETTSEEDQDSQDNMVATSVFSPALDPKALPRSIGLSFTVEATGDTPHIRVCATWARYQEHEQGWKRWPASFLRGSINAAQDGQVWTPEEGVSFRLRSKRFSENSWRVSLFLINITEITEGERPEVSDYLFQPQIRIRCHPGTTLVPVWASGAGTQSEAPPGSMASEDASLELLYRHRTGLARGHLCGATWEEIDPERSQPGLQSPQEAPFAWTDAVAVSENERRHFSPADARTELVPCYQVESPRMDWDDGSDSAPVLDPEALAEAWQPEQLKADLQPLVDDYRAWIESQQALVPDLLATQRSVADSHLQDCRQAADRIQQAIEILAADEDARLAFCFANRAIVMQAHWSGRSEFAWRPFQLAFILLNIPALADPLHPDRQICDLVPDGWRQDRGLSRSCGFHPGSTQAPRLA